MGGLPAVLQIRGRRCVVVGGGGVAQRRAASLRAAGGVVVVVAPRLGRELRALADEVHERGYETGDLRGAMLVVAATDDEALNAAVAEAARESGVLVNRVDAPDAGDFVVPAHAVHEPVTLAVDTGGVSAAAAAAIRRELSAALDPDWPRLLALVAPYRQRLQAAVADTTERQQRLRQLADGEAMRQLKAEGEDAVRARCEKLLGET